MGGGGDMDAAKFTMSSRPMTSQGNRDDDNEDIYSEVESRKRDEHEDFNVSDVIYYTSDWLVTNISDNTKIQKLPVLKFDPKSLQLPAHSGMLSAAGDSRTQTCVFVAFKLYCFRN